MTSEVKKTLEEMKNKSPCRDTLTSDVMMRGGEESVKQITKKNVKVHRDLSGRHLSMSLKKGLNQLSFQKWHLDAKHSLSLRKY